jgi:hypothetical protein
MPDRDAIYQEIETERRSQDRQWGGPWHDDTHSPLDWWLFINRQWERGGDDTRVSHAVGLAGWHANVRGRFVKIAALAVAAIESIDRYGADLSDRDRSTDRDRGGPVPGPK